MVDSIVVDCTSSTWEETYEVLYSLPHSCKMVNTSCYMCVGDLILFGSTQPYTHPTRNCHVFDCGCDEAYKD